MLKMEDFSYFSKKTEAVIYTEITKYEKTSIFPIIDMCLNNHNYFKIWSFCCNPDVFCRVDHPVVKSKIFVVPAIQVSLLDQKFAQYYRGILVFSVFAKKFSKTKINFLMKFDGKQATKFKFLQMKKM